MEKTPLPPLFPSCPPFLSPLPSIPTRLFPPVSPEHFLSPFFTFSFRYPPFPQIQLTGKIKSSIYQQTWLRRKRPCKKCCKKVERVNVNGIAAIKFLRRKHETETDQVPQKCSAAGYAWRAERTRGGHRCETCQQDSIQTLQETSSMNTTS